MTLTIIYLLHLLYKSEVNSIIYGKTHPSYETIEKTVKKYVRTMSLLTIPICTVVDLTILTAIIMILN